MARNYDYCRKKRLEVQIQDEMDVAQALLDLKKGDQVLSASTRLLGKRPLTPSAFCFSPRKKMLAQKSYHESGNVLGGLNK